VISSDIIGGLYVLGRVESLRAYRYPKDIPVVMLSSSIQEREIQLCRELGALDYLRKPLTLKAFEAVMSRIGIAFQLEKVTPSFQSKILLNTGSSG
jgi:CheY-like chemotaxis protein